MSWIVQWFITDANGEKEITQRYVVYANSQIEATKEALRLPAGDGTMEVMPLNHIPSINWDAAKEA